MEIDNDRHTAREMEFHNIYIISVCIDPLVLADKAMEDDPFAHDLPVANDRFLWPC